MKNVTILGLFAVLLLLGSCAQSEYVPSIPNTPFVDTTKTTEVKLQIGNGHLNTQINKLTENKLLYQISITQHLDSRAKYQLGFGPYFSLKKLNNNWTGSFTVQLSTSTTRMVTGTKYCPDCQIDIKHNGNQFSVGAQFNLLSNRQNAKTGLSIYTLVNLAGNYEIYESNYNLFSENIIESQIKGNFQYVLIGLHYEERFKQKWQYSLGAKIPLPSAPKRRCN